jgi:heat shock protein HslJ
MRRRHLALIATLALSLAACGTPGSGGSVDGSWDLVSGTVDGQPLPMVDSAPITLVFEPDGLGGRAACNQYFGDYEVDGDSVTITGLGQTEMGCDPAVMDSEAAYLAALARVDTVEADGDSLTLTGDGVELSFERSAPIPTADLTGTVWVLDGLVDNDSVSSTIADSRATLEFFTDGSLIGSTGCRDLNGSYELDGSLIDVARLNADGECDDDLAGQDEHVVTVLEGGFDYVIDHQTLTLTGEDGLGLVYIAGS